MPNRPTREASPFRGNASELAALLKERRLELSLSQEALARATGLSLNTVRNVEKLRVVEPGFFTVALMARELGLTLGDLTPGTVTD